MAVISTIDVAALVSGSDVDLARTVGEQIVAACEGPGVFQIIGHGVDPDLQHRLEHAAREFFALDDHEKSSVAMTKGGAAWRGWFPLGGELTAGVADAKEGLYFGTDLPPEDHRVSAGLPLHGANLYPTRPAELRSLVPAWITAVTAAGRAVLRGISLGVGGDGTTFDAWCTDPTVLFRIFHYPATSETAPRGATTALPLHPQPSGGDANASNSPAQSTDHGGTLGVGEHTDYGLLTLLAQDRTGGLQVRSNAATDTDAPEWIDVEPVPGALVCNLGDMLQRVSGGRFVATPHRVVAPAEDRISMPLFLDPGWDVQLGELPELRRTRLHAQDTTPHTALGTAGDRVTAASASHGVSALEAAPRWDGDDIHTVEGSYSDYLLSRVARVFPDLFAAVTEEEAGV